MTKKEKVDILISKIDSSYSTVVNLLESFISIQSLYFQLYIFFLFIITISLLIFNSQLQFINYKYLISCNDGDPIKVWNIHSYSTENNYDPHFSIFEEFSKPDNKIIDIKINTNHKNILASLDSDSFIRWDIGQEYHKEVSSHLPTTLVPSKESTIEFFTLTDERIKNINPPSKSWWKFDPYKYYHFDISPDGSKIAIVTIDNNIIVIMMMIVIFNLPECFPL